jgi:transcriptional regulator with XRE-family HTH domain
MSSRTARTPIEQAELDEFARRLTDLMARRGMSQSDLAAAIWGRTEDTRGRNSARNRDRISHYVRGSQMPEPKTMVALAKVLGVEPADLNPALDRAAAGRVAEPPLLTMVGGRPDLAVITINRMVPMRVAVQILSLLVELDRDTIQRLG